MSVTELTFPYPLPKIYRRWRTETVLTLARQIYTEKAWDLLPMLADALEETGFHDELMLRHLRGIRPCLHCSGTGIDRGKSCYWCGGSKWKKRVHTGNYVNGCFKDQCWVVNHILDYDQPVMATFAGSERLRQDVERHEASVINPGSADGEVYLLYVADCFQPPLYIVEANGIEEALDEFVESTRLAGVIIDLESSEADDYGLHCHRGDSIGGKNITEECWITLRGKVVPGPLTEPSTTGGGTYYDSDNIQFGSPHNILYFGPGLPPEGVDPKDYARRQPCDNCKQVFIPNMNGATNDYCSQVCENHWTAPKNAGFVICPACDLPCWLSREESAFAVAADAPLHSVATCELHFPSPSDSSYAMPAKSSNEILEDDDGDLLDTVCPGSLKLGEVVPWG